MQRVHVTDAKGVYSIDIAVEFDPAAVPFNDLWAAMTATCRRVHEELRTVAASSGLCGVQDFPLDG